MMTMGPLDDNVLCKDSDHATIDTLRGLGVGDGDEDGVKDAG